MGENVTPQAFHQTPCGHFLYIFHYYKIEPPSRRVGGIVGEMLGEMVGENDL